MDSHGPVGRLCPAMLEFVSAAWHQDAVIDLNTNAVKGQAVERLDKYKFLGMFIDVKFSFDKTEELQQGTAHTVYITLLLIKAFCPIICTPGL